MKNYLVPLLVAAAFFCSSFIDYGYQTKNVEHTMKSGETVWQVASRMMGKQDKHRDVRDLIDDIREKNDLWGSKLGKIKPGDVIVIPLQCKQ